MKSARLEFLLGVLVVIGLGYFGFKYFGRPAGGQTCSPMTLSPEVKAYIDSKLSAPAAVGGDLATLNARLAEFETKFKTIDKDFYLKADSIIETRRIAISARVREHRQSVAEVSAAVRDAELRRLRLETATTCAGVSKVYTKPRPDRAKAPLISAPADNSLPATEKEKTDALDPLDSLSPSKGSGDNDGK